MNIEQERQTFEEWCAMESLPTSRIESGEYINDDTWSSWQAWKARAALQSQDREGIIKAARAAMNESFEVGDEYGSIGIPSDRAAYLSLLLDEYDHARRVDGDK